MDHEGQKPPRSALYVVLQLIGILAGLSCTIAAGRYIELHRGEKMSRHNSLDPRARLVVETTDKNNSPLWLTRSIPTAFNSQPFLFRHYVYSPSVWPEFSFRKLFLSPQHCDNESEVIIESGDEMSLVIRGSTIVLEDRDEEIVQEFSLPAQWCRSPFLIERSQRDRNSWITNQSGDHVFDLPGFGQGLLRVGAWSNRESSPYVRVE